MDVSVYDYAHSKHSRIIKSIGKKYEKLVIKNKNTRKYNEMKYKPKNEIKCNKSYRECQRKQWRKSNKNKRSRNCGVNLVRHDQYYSNSVQHYPAYQDIYGEFVEYSDFEDTENELYVQITSNEIRWCIR